MKIFIETKEQIEDPIDTSESFESIFKRRVDAEALWVFDKPDAKEPRRVSWKQMYRNEGKKKK